MRRVRPTEREGLGRRDGLPVTEIVDDVYRLCFLAWPT